MVHQHHAGHQHNRVPMEKRQDAGTVVQYVYKTAAKTFDGPIGGYKTVAAQPENTPATDSSSSNDNSNSNSDSSSSNNDNTNSNANADSQKQVQQQATQQAAQSSAEAAASAAAVSDAIAKAMATQQQAAATSVAAVPTEQKAQPTPIPVKSKAAAKDTSTSSSKEATKATKTPVAAATSSKASESSPTSSFIESTNSASSSTPSHTAAASTGSSGGLSSGGKAGLAIGILLLVGLLLAGLFFCYRRRKNREAEAYGKAVDDEKSTYAGDLNRSNTNASTRTTTTAPRLSLRPVTQFLPDLAAKGKAANAAGVAGGAAGGTAAGAAMASRNQNDPANPFGNHAAVQLSQRSSDEEKTMLPIQGTLENPFADNAAAPGLNGPASSMPPLADAPAPLRIKTPTPEAAAAAGAGAGLVGAGAVAAAKHNERSNAPKALNLSPNRPVSPAGASPAVSEFSQTPVSPGVMTSGPPPSNVHRIQLDFKPSMDDELSLRAGQLVRLLHEYDDGWALCIRLDRSQQGVAPRTCLSARPVKPRPPPNGRAGPGPRGPPPPGMMGPGQQRPQSPAGGRGSPSPYGRQPRAMSPGPSRGSQQRSMSPGPYGGGPQRPAVIPAPGSKRRSNSASDIQARRMSPPGPSPMNPNVQRVPMQQQVVTSPDFASVTNRSAPVSMMPPNRKPVPGHAM